MFALYSLFLPPLSPVDPDAAADDSVAEYDYFVYDRTATTERTGKQSHSLPQISPIFPYISCTRHCYCCCYDYNPIQLHSLIFCRPLMYLLLILCCLLSLILYSAVSPAHC